MANNLTEEIEYFRSKNVEIDIIDSNKIRTVFLQARKSLTLQVVLQEDYPSTWPISLKCQTLDLNGMKSTRQEAIQNFLKTLDLELNQIIDLNHGKSLLIKMYSRIVELIENDQFLKESFSVLESKSKDNKFHQTNMSTHTDLASKNNQPRKSKHHPDTQDQETKQKFKGSDFIFQRIKWDQNIDKNQVIIGYLDRFLGIKEIKFNEFKGVHEDRDGVPLHRVRYFKINDKIIWDREKKLDLITGVGDISNFFTKLETNNEEKSVDEQKDNFVNSPILHFKCNQWKEPTDPMEPYSLDKIQILTYNVMSRANFARSIDSRISLNKNCGLENLDRIDRRPYLLSLIESRSPCFVLLQECEEYEEEGLLACDFIRDNYFICSMKRENNQHSNCVILSKVKPSSHLTYPLSNNSNKSAQICTFEIRSKNSQKVQKLMIINIHLSSNKVVNSFQKREIQLKNLKAFIDKSDPDYTFIGGDFNFGDSSVQEMELLKSLYLDNNFKDMAPNCHTFDPSSNFCSAITSSHKEPRRMDRILLRTRDKNLVLDKYFLVNTQPFKIEPSEQIKLDDYLNIRWCYQTNQVDLTLKKSQMALRNSEAFYLNASDHYGLECQFSFWNNLEQVKLVHKSTLAVVVPKNLSDEFIQPIRKLYDPQISRWPPHLNILYPFYENIEFNDEEESSIVGDMAKILSNYETFACHLTQIDTFIKNNVVFLKPDAKSENILNSIYSDLKHLFKDDDHSKWTRAKLSAHLTIAQPDDKRNAKKNWALDTLSEIKSNYQQFINKKPLLEFEVDCLYWMTRTDSTPFKIRRTFPLGKRYPSIPRGLKSIDGVLLKFMSEKNYLTSESESTDFDLKVSQVKRKIENLSKNYLNKFEIVTVGSYQLGILSNDVDLGLVCVKSDFLNPIDQLTQALRQDSYFKVVRPINDAVVPIIELQIDDDTLSGIDIQIFQIDEQNFPISNLIYDNYQFMTSHNLEYTKLYPLSGLFENDNLKKYVYYYKDFQVVLNFVKYWAKCRNIYGKAFGHLGGISWALMVVVFLRQKHEQFSHELELDQNSERFGKILREFFKFYSEWNWNQPITVLDYHKANEFLDKNNQRSFVNILQTVYPYHNTSKIVSDVGKKYLIKEISRSFGILSHSSDYELVCNEQLDVPFKKIAFEIEFNHMNDINHLFTLIKAKILGLVTNLEKSAKLEFRPVTKLFDSNAQNSNFNHQKKFFIYVYGSVNYLADSDKEFIISHCRNFIQSIKTLSHVNEFRVSYQIE